MSQLSYRRTLTPSVRRARRRSLLGLVLICFGLVLSLGGIVRVSALPAEARVQETWFAYTHELKFDYTARVTKSNIYQRDLLTPQELLRVQVPVEPPVYRRVLLSQMADSLTVMMPYRFKSDRPATINATYRIDGVLVAANLWQRAYPFKEVKTVSVTGSELVLDDLTITIPLKTILQELEATADRLKIGHDQVELKIRPVIKVDVEGQQEPITTTLAPEFTVAIRGVKIAVEVDEPKNVDEEKSFTSLRVSPLTVEILGQTLPLDVVRTVSIVALTVLALILGATLVVKWVKGRMSSATDLSRLGNSLIIATSFDMPANVAIVDVQTVTQLVSIHLRTDRPVVQVEGISYLVDGTTCYRYRDNSAAEKPAV